jgi:hypothetical protein
MRQWFPVIFGLAALFLIWTYLVQPSISPVKCPMCGGTGTLIERIPSVDPYTRAVTYTERSIPCMACNRTGKVSRQKAAELGPLLDQYREKKDLTPTATVQ